MVDIILYKSKKYEIKQEVCPFCDGIMNVIDIENSDKYRAIVNFKCECDWEHSTLIDTRKSID